MITPKEKYFNAMSLISAEIINKNLEKKAVFSDEKFYTEYKLPNNMTQDEFGIFVYSLLEEPDVKQFEDIAIQIIKDNSSLTDIKIKSHIAFTLDVVCKISPKDIKWFHEKLKGTENADEATFARWVQKTFNHNYSYTLCPENKQKLINLVEGM